MKKILQSIIAVVCLLAMQSCNDFLDRKPLDFDDEDAFFHNAEQLKWFVNDIYSLLPTNNSLWGGLYADDIVSDNQCGSSPQSLLYKGDKRTVKIANSGWNFSRTRSLNYYINKVEGKISNGELSGSDPDICHYLGEGYFLRAWDYYRLLRNYGDVPILTEMLPNDQSVLNEHSVRNPRNEVARFILSDLDKAIKNLKENAPETGRITRDAAYALKSRVALFEATWERYHAGTCFVPGNDKWPGKTTWPDFKFEAGSAEAEVNYFLDQAIEAADAVASKRKLDADYQAMFVNFEAPFPDDDEVILARYYSMGVLSHSCSAYLKGGGGCNATRALVNTFLMQNGLPIYAEGSGYQGDLISYYEMQGRDPRLTGSVRAAGRLIETRKVDGKNVNDTIFYHKPSIDNTGTQKATTGYELNKWCSEDTRQRTQYLCTTATPILRAAECYINYIEAYYERYHNLGGNCDKYWKALRQRAGIDTDYQKTIANTDLTQENDLAVYSKGNLIDPTLYNIRRERRCEFIAEGLRLDDLKRWRSLDSMVEYQPEGLNFWDELYKMYTSKQRTADIVSQSNISKFIRPLQISATSAAYDGYTFPKPHYLEPIPISEFLLTGGGETDKSPLYQNPGWPQSEDGIADYNYDCD